MALCAAVAAGTMLTGCAGGGSIAGGADLGEGYPMEGDNHLSYWVVLDSNLATTVTNMGDTEYAKALQEKTGVTIEYQHPTSSNVQEALNIMLLSGDLPDLIEYSWGGYSGGLPMANQNGSIIQLNDYIDDYAPDYKKFLDENPMYQKMVVSDNGDYLGIPFLRGDRSLLTSYGLIIRQDWLDDLNLPMPETIEDYYNTLKAFKEQKGAELPFSANIIHTSGMGVLIGAYGVDKTFFVKDDKVVYGPAQPEYKEFLKEMHKWYDEKLLDNNFPTLDQKTINSNMLNGFSGLTSGSGGSGLGLYNETAKTMDPNMKFAGAPYPVLHKGEKPQFGQIQGYCNGEYVAVSSSCENVEAAVKFLNYGYTEEGHMLNNFGEEGVSYIMENGYPTYTDLIVNNPDGLPMNTALGMYVRAAGGGGPFVQDPRYIEQYYRTPEQKEAWQLWTSTEAEKHILPQLYIDQEKQSDFTAKCNEIQTYQDEMFSKFVMGTEDIEGFDAYVETLEGLGLNDVLDMYQEAYDRYLKR